MSAGKYWLNLAAGLLCLVCSAPAAESHACVWKITAPNNGTLYLGGSIHALRSTDYPLPPAYNQAFDASERLAFEVDLKTIRGAAHDSEKAGRYPRGDSLKNHVDPRTYEYLRRFFAILKIPEPKFASYRPWYLAEMLQVPQLHGLSPDLGVEGYLAKRAQANHKPITGLETGREAMEVFAGLNDRQSEAILLLTFIPHEGGGNAMTQMTAAWRRGDADTIAREMKNQSADFPAFEERLIDARNRQWLPSIERALRSGHTYFVVVGSGHLGGPTGLLELLRSHGYQIAQL